MTLGWLWQRRHKNAGIVDVIWALGVGASAMFYALVGDGAVWPRSALAVLGGLWGARLGLHLWRRVRSEEEDGRYRNLREHWQGSQGKFFLFFQFQALLIVMFSMPFLAVARNRIEGPTPWLPGRRGGLDRQRPRRGGRGSCSWHGVGADPANRGKTCRAGLWRYSRHPNYFFEWLHWFAYVALAVGSPWCWLSLAGPVVMYVFLRWISGIPYTEAQAVRTRGDDYRGYQRTTPMLFPWFPKSDRARVQ